MKSVGERIRQARLAKRMSAETLARRVGYKTQSGISNIENRDGGTGGARLSRIAQELNVSLEWLLTGPDGPDVPFIATPPATLHTPARRGVMEKAAPPYPGWPFTNVSVDAVHRVLARLDPAQAQIARTEMERSLQVLLEYWSNQADRVAAEREKTRGAA